MRTREQVTNGRMELIKLANAYGLKRVATLLAEKCIDDVEERTIDSAYWELMDGMTTELQPLADWFDRVAFA